MGLILCLADVHATRHAPSSCTDSYWPDLLDLLDQAVAVAADRRVSAIVLAGDVFHHKAPTRTDHAVVRSLKERLIWPSPCPVLAVPGNHDMQHDRIESVTQTQPLGVLEEPGGLRLLDGWAEGSHPLYGVPWQQEWSEQRIRKVLVDLTGARGLVVTHAPIYPPGREPHYPGAEFTPASWWADAMGGEGYVFYGHVHEPHGTWRHEGVTFCNNGALSRGSLDESNRTRQVGCTLWDGETGEFEFVPLRAKPAGEVFRLREHGEAVARRVTVDSLLAAAGRVTLPVLSVENVLARIRELNPGDGVCTLAEELLMAEQGGRS